MRIKILVIVFLFLSFLVISFLFFKSRANRAGGNVSVSKVDDRGIFVGEKSKKIPGEPIQERIGKEIVEASENLSKGRDYFANGQYELAAEAFKSAYLPRYGEKAVGGLYLARSYEKLGRYDEGIALLDQMIQNGELSEKGILNANEIKSRLIASKNQTSATSAQTNSNK